jgi:hypothetical protein
MHFYDFFFCFATQGQRCLRIELEGSDSSFGLLSIVFRTFAISVRLSD